MKHLFILQVNFSRFIFLQSKKNLIAVSAERLPRSAMQDGTVSVTR